MTSKEHEAMMPEQNPGAPPPAYGQPGYPQQQPGYPQQQQPGYPPQQQQGQGYVYSQQPGAAQPGGPMVVVMAPQVQNPPPDHMMFNIIVTICCCWPIGIFAILKSMATRDAVNRGDASGAMESSRQARRLGFWALGVGIAFVAITIVLIVVVYAVILIPNWGRYKTYN